MRAVIVVLVVHDAADIDAHVDKARRQPPGALALKTDAAVLPVAEALDEVCILVGDVYAAGVGNVTVKAGDFTVVAVVEVEPVHILMHGIEDEHLNACVAQAVDRLAAEALDVAEIVEDDLDLNAFVRFGAEELFKL